MIITAIKLLIALILIPPAIFSWLMLIAMIRWRIEDKKELG